MTWLDAYLSRLRSQGEVSKASGIEATASEFCTEFLDSFDYCSQASALLVGNVQSGKTGQMFGIISAAADRDFFIFVILTTDNILLQQQTLSRVKLELPEFCVCGEDDSVAFEVNNGVKPVVVVLKKNARTLRRWEKTFRTSRIAESNPLFILDDEADAASLNAKVNQNDVSTINRHIAAIRQNASSSVFLEVTGTPQSIFLQTVQSGWMPDYVLAFQPGSSYLGGDFFFSGRSPVSKSIGFTDNDPNPIRTFVVRHLAVTAVSFMRGAEVSNALAHVSAMTAEHSKVRDEIRRILTELRGPALRPLLEKELADIKDAALLDCSADAAESFIRTTVLPNVRVIVKNSKSNDDAEFRSGCNFIVGGNSLSRGVTFPRLNTVLYTRVSKRPQADTIWQHNRIFGYDRDPKLIRVYLTKHLWKLLSGINDQNNSIYAQIRAGIQHVKISLPKELAATRKAVLDQSSLQLLAGSVNRYPDALRNSTADRIDSMLDGIPNTGYVRKPLPFIRSLLRCVISEDEDFIVTDYDGIFEQMLAENPDEQAVLIVRRGRSVTQGTGALLSPNDWQLGESFPKETVVTLYRIEGGNGWSSNPIWVPNIRLPSSENFYVMRQ